MKTKYIHTHIISRIENVLNNYESKFTKFICSPDSTPENFGIYKMAYRISQMNPFVMSKYITIGEYFMNAAFNLKSNFLTSALQRIFGGDSKMFLNESNM